MKEIYTTHNLILSLALPDHNTRLQLISAGAYNRNIDKPQVHIMVWPHETTWFISCTSSLSSMTNPDMKFDVHNVFIGLESMMYGGPYLISDQWLAVLVRQVALHANVSHAHHMSCVYCSSAHSCSWLLLCTSAATPLHQVITTCQTGLVDCAR